MPKSGPFDTHTDRYERWFDEHDEVYRSELDALDRLVPSTGDGIEIGVGSARFAAPLGIDVGIDPAEAMLEHARERGVEVVRGVAEALPFRDDTFDTVLLVTTICFVDDVPRTLAEADRILTQSGQLVIGFVDANSPVGRRYREQKAESPFYRNATFVSTDELVEALETAGFTDFEFVQTVSHSLDETDEVEPVEPGYGEGSFVGIKARR